MPDTDFTLKVIERIASTFGPIIGAILLLLCLLIVGLAIFFKNRIAFLAEEISKESVAQFQKRLDLLFRDEILRNNLRGYLGQRSLDKKLQLYDDVYSLYFKYQKSWNFTTATPPQEFQQLWSDILALRHKLFLNAIYLGPMIDYLMPAVIGMMDGLGGRALRDVHSASDTKLEAQISESINKASKWITDNLATHQDVAMYDLKSDMLKSVADQRDKFVDEQFTK